jgi:hypothetical protein
MTTMPRHQGSILELLIWTLAAMHTGVVQNKSIAGQVDRFLLDLKKKEKFSCPVFLPQCNLLL